MVRAQWFLSTSEDHGLPCFKPWTDQQSPHDLTILRYTTPLLRRTPSPPHRNRAPPSLPSAILITKSTRFYTPPTRRFSPRSIVHRSLHWRYRRYMQLPKNDKSDDHSSEPPMASTLETLLSYLRIPVLASSGIAAVLSGLLYFKQKYGVSLSPKYIYTTQFVNSYPAWWCSHKSFLLQ
jgi:hypothetical protein